MNKTLRALVGAALLAVTGLAAADTFTTTVDAKNNSIAGGVGGADSFILIADSTFSVTATGTWQNDPNPAYLSDADGHDGSTYTYDGQTFDIGALVGQIGDGAFFLVGSSLQNASTGNGGLLKLFYWDSDAYNNLGHVEATVTAVPEPTNIALMGLALGAFALTRRRKA